MKFGFEKLKNPVSEEESPERKDQKSSRVGKLARAATLGAIVSLGPAAQDNGESARL